MQDWSSEVWKNVDKQPMLVSNMSLEDCLQAIWAMYILGSKHSCYVHLPYTVLGRSVYSQMRNHLTELNSQ